MLAPRNAHVFLLYSCEKRQLETVWSFCSPWLKQFCFYKNRISECVVKSVAFLNTVTRLKRFWSLCQHAGTVQSLCVVCLHVGLPWSHMTPRGWVLLETAQHQDTVDLELPFRHYTSESLLVLPKVCDCPTFGFMAPQRLTGYSLGSLDIKQ